MNLRNKPEILEEIRRLRRRLSELEQENAGWLAELESQPGLTGETAPNQAVSGSAGLLSDDRFENSPIPMTDEDWSAAKKIADSLRASGVQDIRQYVRKHPELLAELAPAVKILDANAAAVRTYKAASKAVLLEAFNEPPDLTTYNPETGLSDIFVELVQRFSEGETRVEMEGPDTALDGSVIYIRTTTSIARGREHDWGRVIQTVEDFTARKAAEESLQVAKKQAEDANKSKSEFLARMSHDLRTPLNAILGFSEIIENEILGPIEIDAYKVYAQDIHQSGAHLLDLINDLLDLSKIEAGQYELSETTVALPEVVTQVLRLVAPDALKKRVGLTASVSQDLPHLRADPRSTRQMLLNLLSNAVKFTPDGGKVSVDTCFGNDGLGIKVTDTGIGIAPESLERVFEPFAQIEASQADRHPAKTHPGTGLGLSIVKALIELHGGRIEIESKLGTGTTAILRFPRERAIA
ncbi:HAMP domain-containing sensor histidine kinase [Pelagibius sp. Alg239-R121]|uniref:sensor histidine kinase n=1 Tax=Pelagibius sp. Alg239-R121 TaxID=2993448 RepID=UPI0024A6A3AC|nr:HAMP domain-containing sensor histidine kinase [Pelagibius sp. Alg239-R121]